MHKPIKLMSRIGLAGVAALTLAGATIAPGAAFAQRFDNAAYWHGDRARIHHRHYVRARRGTFCVKLCPNDFNPCDPPQYKQFDSRCRP